VDRGAGSGPVVYGAGTAGSSTDSGVQMVGESDDFYCITVQRTTELV
jgi:hypothetical protein